MKEERISFQDIELFYNITEEDLNTLLYCLRSFEREYRKNEILIFEQEKVQYIGIVLGGRVHMMKEDIWGGQTMLGYMEAGDMVGETFAVQKEQESHVTFIAATDVRVLYLPAANVIHPCPRQCGFHAQLTQNMFDLLGRKNVRMLEKIEVSSKPTLREKILSYLALLAQKQNSRYVKVPLNRSELAEYLGANRSSMTRELSAMKKEGIIDFDRDTFIIK